MDSGCQRQGDGDNRKEREGGREALRGEKSKI